MKRDHKCSNMVANILPADPSPPTRTPLTLGSNSTFSEHGPVAYQIKWNDACSNVVGSILPTDPLPPTDPGDGVIR